ncbi:MAG: hypothetical protein WCK00_11555 [Deltaproteobacteria bacterium]
MSYERPLLSTLRTALSRPTPVIHVLIGPRQVGKTTIARQLENSIGIPSVYATGISRNILQNHIPDKGLRG